MKKLLTSVAVATAIANSAYAGWFDSKPVSVDKAITEQQEKLMKEAERATGLPAITNFTERRMVKWLYELRDQPNYRTYTYLVTMQGKLIKFCDSVGYGINASIQYSNPEKMVHDYGMDGRSAAFTKQAEPNALFTPDGLAATYVMCVDNTTDDVRAVYIEPEIVVSPFPLDYVNNQ